jgi:tRNA pseudouridine32 synthase/23S rRNA pseudouridine746 synthase
MLSGMTIDEDPLLLNDIAEDALELVYQDESIAVVNKPSGLLSVPGKNIKDSVYARMKEKFPNATGPLIVHRLDMSTSGLMVIALTKDANKHLQQQFIKRTVKKRYIALLEGMVTSANESLENEGDIKLPLIVDFDDRPRQMVCFDTGKIAQTHWEIISPIAEQKLSTTRVRLYPQTGRTHQLRVHCAHTLGLNMPIVGDDLYGTVAERLHLHAELLVIVHPTTQQLMTFEVSPDF